MLKGSGSQKNINNENHLYDLEKPTGKATVPGQGVGGWGGGLKGRYRERKEEAEPTVLEKNK